MSCIDYNKRLYIYWNLHKKTWSVRQSGKIVGHSDLIFLKDCRFLVGKAGQARVRAEKKKNVHAGVSGYLAMNAEFCNADYNNTDRDCFVMYNPYKHDTFVQRTGVCDDKYPIPVTESGWAKLYVLGDRPTVQAVDQEVHDRIYD
jgi:hypothetical protein